MKRWFIPLVCLVLVFSMVAPFPALAASSFVDMADYYTNTYEAATYQNVNYSYSGGSRYHCFQYLDSVGYNQYGYSTYTNLDVSYASTTGSLDIKSGLFYCYPCASAANRKTDSALVSGIMDVADFKSITFTIVCTLTSTVDATCTAKLGYTEVDSAYWANSTFYGSAKSVSLAAGANHVVELSCTVSALNSSLSVAVAPFAHIIFSDPPSNGSIQVSINSFKCSVKIAPELPDYPIFSKNVSGSFTYLKGSEASPLSVSAYVSDGGTLGYTWYRNNVASTTGGSYVADGMSCTPSTSVSGTFYYFCYVSNTWTTGQVSSSTSNLVTINVIEPPASPQITQNLGAGIAEYEQGDPPLALTVQAITTDGGTLSYQWYENNADSTEGGSMIEGATLTHYFPSTASLGIKYYYCVVTNTIAGYTTSTISSVAAVRVVSPPDPATAPVITSDLSTGEVIYLTGSAAAALRIGAEAPDGGELTYQWYSKSSPDDIGVAIPGANIASFTPETVVAGTTWYLCVVTNKLNDTIAQVTSKVAMITVQDPPPETTPPELGEMNDKLDDTNNFLDNIADGISGMWEAITGLPQAILDGIKGLFVPDAEAIAAYQDQWSELLADRFGAIYESVDVVGNFVESLNTGTTQETISFPSVTVDLAGIPWTFGGWTVDVVPDGFGFLVSYSRFFVNVVATFAFINGLRNKFEGILGGGG